jgi:Domain of unknown function (DUF6458)
MKTGAGLALICVGAILAFAVTTNTSFFNLHTAGWVLIFIGVIGLLLTHRTRLSRQVVRRRYPSSVVEQVPVQYVRNPGTQALQAAQPTRPTLLDQDDDLIDQADVPRTPSGHPVASTEVIEDLYEQP